MDKNYYEILEIDKKASPEIVEKAYKTLVKKYHPDLQDVSQKQFYEDKLKLINEAYEVLSLPEKRKEYDLTLPKNIPTISTKDYEALYNENRSLKNKIEQSREENAGRQVEQNFNRSNTCIINKNNNSKINNTFNNENKQDLDAILNKAYYDAYIQDLKNRGYKIKYKKSFKDYMKNLIALIITVFILYLIFQIPFIKAYLINNINIIKSIFQIL